MQIITAIKVTKQAKEARGIIKLRADVAEIDASGSEELEVVCFNANGYTKDILLNKKKESFVFIGRIEKNPQYGHRAVLEQVIPGSQLESFRKTFIHPEKDFIIGGLSYHTKKEISLIERKGKLPQYTDGVYMWYKDNPNCPMKMPCSIEHEPTAHHIMPVAKKYAIPADHPVFKRDAPNMKHFWSDGIHLWFGKDSKKTRLSKVFVDHWNRNHTLDQWIHFVTDDVLKSWTEHNSKLGPIEENVIQYDEVEDENYSSPEGLEVY